VTIEPLDGTLAFDLPWVVTFGPLEDDEDWDPVVCGPYERQHAVALAEAVVADEALLAVVEPLLPRVTVEEIQGDLAEAQRADAEAWADSASDADEWPGGNGSRPEWPGGNGSREAWLSRDEVLTPDEAEEPPRPLEPPSARDIRAGFARIAARLTAGPS